MFGMLDYRAHKLYWILFVIPQIIIVLIALFGLPFLNYLIGFQLADTRIFQILISLVSLVIIEIIWIVIFSLIAKLFQFIFSLFVDIIPHDGRTREEAQMVVWNGEKAIRLLALSQTPDTWTDELILEVPKNDWVINLFYRDDVIRRLELVREEYNNLPPDSPFTDAEVAKILEEHQMNMGWYEKVVTGRHRLAIVAYLFLLLLFIYNPLAS